MKEWIQVLAVRKKTHNDVASVNQLIDRGIEQPTSALRMAKGGFSWTTFSALKNADFNQKP